MRRLKSWGNFGDLEFGELVELVHPLSAQRLPVPFVTPTLLLRHLDAHKAYVRFFATHHHISDSGRVIASGCF